MNITLRALLPGLIQLFLLAALNTLAWDSRAKDQDPVFISHVSDSAGVIGFEAAVVDSKLKAFEAATGHKVLVLTVQTTGSRSIEEYAVDVFQKWKVGRKTVDDGVLLVIAVADRKVRIEVGYGLEGELTDAQCSRIIHEVVTPQLAKGEYGAGIQAGVDAVLLTLAAPAPPDAANTPPLLDKDDNGKYVALALSAFLILVTLLASLLGAAIGLLLTGCCALALPACLYPGWPGRLLYAAIITLWVYCKERPQIPSETLDEPCCDLVEGIFLCARNRPPAGQTRAR